MGRIYNRKKNILEAAKERISFLFDTHDIISVSVSGGKDSTVLFNLAYEEAQKRNREIECFFLDEEMIFKSSADIIDEMMNRKGVIPKWYQIPFKHGNATSWGNVLVDCFSGEEPLHGYKEYSIKENPTKSDRFYGFLDEYPKTFPKDKKVALLVGLRSAESLNRYRSVIKNPGYKSINWSTKTICSNVNKFYPIYDWGFDDIFKCIYDNNWEYSSIYDKQFAKEYSTKEMRVSSLLHEMSFKCLVDLPEFEPETFEKLAKRVPGVKTARIYAKERQVYKTDKLPNYFNSWIEYRDFILKNIPNEELKKKYQKKFKNHESNEELAKQETRMMLINDFENTAIAFDSKKEEKRKEKKEEWLNLL